MFTFDHGDSLIFDKEIDPIGVGPFRYVDHLSMLDRAFKTDDDDDDDDNDDDDDVGNGADTGGGIWLVGEEETQKRHVQNKEQEGELRRKQKQEQKQEQKHDKKGDDLFAIYVEDDPMSCAKKIYTFMLNHQPKADDIFGVEC